MSSPNYSGRKVNLKSRADALEETWLELQEEIEQVQALAVD